MAGDTSIDRSLDEWPLLQQMLATTQPSLAITNDDVSWLQKCQKVITLWQSERTKRILQQCNGSTCLVWYSNDTSLLSVRVTARNEVGDLHWLQRIKETSEFVVQSCFVKTSSTRFARVFDPMKVFDKTAASHFQCWLDSMGGEYWRDMMPEGILVEGYCWDGALVSPCARMHRQFQSAWYHSKKSDMCHGELFLMELCHWLVTCRCAMHVAHGALKRSLGELATDKFSMTSCWVVFASLRSSIGQLGRCGSSWANQRIAFEDWSMPMEHAEQLWRILGMPAEVVDELLRLQLRWDPSDGRLKVARQFLHSSTVTEEVLKVLKATWKFAQFSESRFIGMGSTSRTLVAGVCLGLQDLVSYIKARPDESNWYINGFARFESKVKDMMALCCMVCFLPESVLAILAADDRLGVVYDQIKGEISDELSFLHTLPACIWEFLSTAMDFGGGGQCFANEVQAAAAASAATIIKEFEYVEHPPFSLCTGNIDAKLLAFSRQEQEPSEEISRKIWLLLKMGFNPNLLKAGIDRLRDMKHSAMTTEQAHAAGAVYLKLHRMYGQETMRARSFAYQMKPLLAADPVCAKVATIAAAVGEGQEAEPKQDRCLAGFLL